MIGTDVQWRDSRIPAALATTGLFNTLLAICPNCGLLVLYVAECCPFVWCPDCEGEYVLGCEEEDIIPLVDAEALVLAGEFRG